MFKQEEIRDYKRFLHLRPPSPSPSHPTRPNRLAKDKFSIHLSEACNYTLQAGN